MTKNTIIIILAAVLFIILFLNPCNGKKTVYVTKTVTTKEVLDNSVKREAVFSRYKDSVKSVVSKYRADADNSKGKLYAAERMVNELLNQPVDTSCTEVISAISAANKEKDSVNHELIKAQDSAYSAQSELIDRQNAFADSLKADIIKIAANEKGKDIEIKGLKKEVRNNKAGKTFWKIAAGVAGGLLLAEKLK